MRVSYTLLDPSLLRLREVQDEDGRKVSQRIIPVTYMNFMVATCINNIRHFIVTTKAHKL